MDIFEHRQPANIFSLHLNKRECDNLRTKYGRIVGFLLQKEYLTEVETEHLQTALRDLNTLDLEEATIDKSLQRFLN